MSLILNVNTMIKFSAGFPCMFLLIAAVWANDDDLDNETFVRVDSINDRHSVKHATFTSELDVSGESTGRVRHGFFRAMDVRGRWKDSRRLFGGAHAELNDYPETCILLDRFMNPHCSGSVLTPYWVLTAAHCISPDLGYAKYNTRTPLRPNDGQIVAFRYLFKHPNYKVVQEDLGRGLDVTALQNDVGLANTRAAVALARHSDLPPLLGMAAYTLEDIKGQEVQVLGFGRTDMVEKGEELLGARLQVVECEQTEWKNCLCVEARSAEPPSGVCSGDSGGPVVYRGVQVGVTSMGPVECSSENATWASVAASVFTVVSPYREVINRTINLAADVDTFRAVPVNPSSSHLASLLNTFAASILLVVYF